MATLERRIAALENRVTTEHDLLVQMPKDDGTYDPVPAGFQGKVMQVVFVEPLMRPLEDDHAQP